MGGFQQLLMVRGGFQVNLPASLNALDAGIEFNPNGTISGGATGWWGYPNDEAAIGASYWIKHDISSQTLTGGNMAANTWYQLDATRTLGHPLAEGGSAIGTVSIAASSGGTVLDSCTATVATS